MAAETHFESTRKIKNYLNITHTYKKFSENFLSKWKYFNVR